MEASAIIAIITVSLSGLGALIATIFQNSSMSRCTEIDCCCFHCVRDVMTKDEMHEMTEIVNGGKQNEVLARPVINK